MNRYLILLMQLILLFCFSLIMLSCVSSVEKDVERAEQYLNDGDIFTDDDAAAGETEDEDNSFSVYAEKGKELLDQYFDQTTGAFTDKVEGVSADVKLALIKVYVECVLGTHGITFVNVFSSFLDQGSGNEFSVFASLIPDDIEDSAQTDFQLAFNAIDNNTQASSLYFKFTDGDDSSSESSSEEESTVPTKDTETLYLESFISFAVISFVSLAYSKTGTVTAEQAALFFEGLGNCADALEAAGVDATVLDTLREDYDFVDDGGTEGDADTTEAVIELLSHNFD
ncbi:MAG: hypothetical protein ABIA04_11760 [Pseudomonadota bacterium]